MKHLGRLHVSLAQKPILIKGDAHVYSNHVEQIKEQITREPRPWPKMKIKRKVESIDDFKMEDFELSEYQPHPVIKMPMAV